MPIKPMSYEARVSRFWGFVDKTETCWLWRGRKFWDGYGRFELLGLPRRSHRRAWVLKNGPIPKGMWVLHKCDTPLCVRPDHLFLGTHTDNMRDCVAKGRHKHCTFHGENHKGSKLTNRDVLKILSLRGSGLTQKQVGDKFGVTDPIVSGIWGARMWKHITKPKEA